MRRIDARGIAAEMIQFETMRNSSAGEQPCETVRCGAPGVAVPFLAAVREPGPTCLRSSAAVDRRPEPRLNASSESEWPLPRIWFRMWPVDDAQRFGDALSAARSPFALIPVKGCYWLHLATRAAPLLHQVAVAEWWCLLRAVGALYTPEFGLTIVASRAVSAAARAIREPLTWLDAATTRTSEGLARLWLHAELPFGMPAPGVRCTRGRLVPRFYLAEATL